MTTAGDRAGGPHFRLLSYNVLALRWDVAALARVVRRLAPDVLVAQEAPTRPGWRARCAEFARRCGLLYVAGGGDAGGNLLLVSPRMAAGNTRAVRTPEPWRDPIRGMVTSSLGLAGPRGGRFGLIGTHLGLRRRGRARQVSYLRRALRDVGSPAVLLADLNEPPGGPSWRALAAAGMVDAADRADPPDRGVPPGRGVPDPFGGATFPSEAPRERIDGILVSPGIRVVEHRVPGEPELRTDLARATDHLPVLATIAPEG